MAARFDLCICREHGRVVLTDGSRGPENCYQGHAIIVARNALSKQQIAPEEAVTLMKAILETPLPKNPTDVFMPLLYNAETYNKFLAINPSVAQGWSSAGIHEALIEPVTERIPANFVMLVSNNIERHAPRIN